MGRPVTSVAYPYGGHDAAVRALVRRSGFEHALTTQRQMVGEEVDPFRVPRFIVANHDVDALDEQLAFRLAVEASSGSHER